MNSCAHVEETEDLALGVLTGARAVRAREHLASCASCRAEYDLFRVECTLFEERAKVAAAPPLALAVAIDERSREPREDAPRFVRATRGVVAALACAAAVLAVVRMDRSTIVPSDPQGERAESAAVSEEPLACAIPASGVVATRAEDLSCVIATTTCEERVTSSTATP